jgi:mRNA interferase MazF
MNKKGKARQGEIFLVNFTPSTGHEYQGKRPALVVQSNNTLKFSNLITVMPFTSNIKNKIKDDILVKKNQVNNLYVDSVLKVYCLMSLDYSRFAKKIGETGADLLAEVKLYLKKHFAI